MLMEVKRVRHSPWGCDEHGQSEHTEDTHRSSRLTNKFVCLFICLFVLRPKLANSTDSSKKHTKTEVDNGTRPWS